MLLDTHAWIWWINQSSELSQKARESIATSALLTISSISCWEFATLVRKGRVVLKERTPEQWMQHATDTAGILVLPITCDIARQAGALPDFHGDPADRIIVATALQHELPVVTKDERLHTVRQLNVIW